MDLIELIKYIALGIIQGITEIFPISSSGHLVIFSHLFLGDTDVNESLKLFLIITNFGSFLALVAYYRKELIKLITSSFRYVFSKERTLEDKDEFNYALKILICIIPIGIVGLLFEDLIPTNLISVGISLFVTAILLFVLFILRNKEFNKQISFINALGIGLFQMFAIIPGISRSGITIVGGVSQKIDIKTVLRFSFLSYIFISIPVSILGLVRAISDPGVINVLGFILAFVFAFIFSLLTVRILNKYVTLKNLIYFSAYCLAIGAFAIILNFI